MLWKFLRGNCHKFRGMLSPYIDGRVTPTEKQALESHLASCQDCRQELESLQATVGFLHRVPMETAPRSFAVIEAKPVSASKVLVPLRWSTAVAVLALMLLFAGDLLHVYPEKKSPSSETPVVAANLTSGSQETPSFTPAPSDLPKLGASQGDGHGNLEVTPTPAISEGQSGEATSPTVKPGVEAVTPVPTPASEKSGGNATTIADNSYRWPVHQVEYALLGVAVLMLAATIIVWRRSEKASVKVRNDDEK